MLTLLRHLFTPHVSNNHRPRIIHPQGLFVITTLLLLTHAVVRAGTHFAPLSSVLGFSSSITPAEVIELTNKERVANNLSPLVNNAKLSEAATAKAADMFQNQYWAHVSPTGVQPWHFIQQTGYAYGVAGENLARDFSTTGSMVDAWMNSPSHRRNLLHTRYKEIGVAVVDGRLMGVETTLVVQMFGAPYIAGEISPTAPSTSNKKAENVAPAKVQKVVEIPAEPQQADKPDRAVLAESINRDQLISPVTTSKALSMAAIFLLAIVLIYDLFIATRRNTVRIVGKNLAHIILLVLIGTLVILYKGGALL